MKLLFSILSGVVIFALVMWADWQLVVFLTKALETPQQYVFAVKLVLLFFTGSLALWVAILGGIFCGMVVDAAITDWQNNRKRKKRWKKQN